MITSNVVSKEATNNNEGLVTIVLSIQYIGIDTSNSKSATKNNNKEGCFVREYEQFLLMIGTGSINCVKLSYFWQLWSKTVGHESV